MPATHSRSPAPAEVVDVLNRISEVSARLAARPRELDKYGQSMEGGQQHDKRTDHRNTQGHQVRHRLH